MNWLRPHHSPIGIDITSATIRAMQMQRHGKQWVVRDMIELARLRPAQPFDAEEAQRLAGVLRRRTFVGQDVVVALPNRHLIRGLIEVNAKPGGDAFLAAAENIERTHHLTPGSYELAAWLPPASGERRQAAVCVNGCTHEIAESFYAAFQAAGLNVIALDSRACALSRVIDTDDPRGNHLTAVLDVEHDGTELVLLHRGGVAYQRPLIDAGLDHALKRLTDLDFDAQTAAFSLRNIGLSDPQSAQHKPVHRCLIGYAQTLLQEAGPALEYASRMYGELPIQRFALVGEGADVPLLGFELRQQFKLGPASSQPELVAGLDEHRGFAVAMGLTLHPEEASWAAA